MEQIKKQLEGGKYDRAAMLKYNDTKIRMALNDIDERLIELEKVSFPDRKRLKATKAQRVLILHHLGLLDSFTQLSVSKNNKAQVLSVVIDSDPDVEKDMNLLAKKSPAIISEYNYKFLVKFFEKVGLEKQAAECDSILSKIISSAEKFTKK